MTQFFGSILRFLRTPFMDHDPRCESPADTIRVLVTCDDGRTVYDTNSPL